MRTDPARIAEIGLAAARLDRLLERHMDLYAGRRWRLAAVGKGAAIMAEAVAAASDVRDGIIVLPHGSRRPSISRTKVIEGDHPLPGLSSLAAGIALLDYVKSLDRGDNLIFLVSGGASSLVEVPLVPLEDLRDLWSLMFSHGLDIWEVNTVRKRLSAIKGGRLGLEAARRKVKVLTLIASDVPCDDRSLVGSGLTVPDPTTPNEAILVLKRRGLWRRLPSSVKRVLEKLDGRDTPAKLPHKAVIVARNRDVLKGLSSTIGGRVLTSCLTGEAKEVGRSLAWMLAERGGTIIAGGEPSVTVKGKGRGGRTSELALSFAYEAWKLGRMRIVAVATDGSDGNTGAAGVWADSNTWGDAEGAGLDVDRALLESDTYSVFEALGHTIVTGPTGTNLNTFIVASRGLWI